MANGKPGPAKGDERSIDNGRKGAATLREKFGSDEEYKEHFRKIGQKGGQATKEKYGPELYSQIGRKGGESVRRERGSEYYSHIGQIGGKRGKKNAL